jgi:hypothetical protein
MPPHTTEWQAASKALPWVEDDILRRFQAALQAGVPLPSMVMTETGQAIEAPGASDVADGT